jgi:hypothetical protein
MASVLGVDESRLFNPFGPSSHDVLFLSGKNGNKWSAGHIPAFPPGPD